MISVITVTNKKDKLIINNIFNNYKRQIYPLKELILIINSNEDIELYNEQANQMNIENYHIYKLHPLITLGDCLNYSIKKMNGMYWAKMDDDDYYGEQYLIEAHYNLLKTKADLIGKKSIHLYNEDTKTMYDLNQSKNKYVSFVRGPTLFCNKSLFHENNNYYMFDSLNHGEDTAFLNKLLKNKKKIYATSENNFIYIRKKSLNQTSITPIKKYLGYRYKIIKSTYK